jgi:hypothetical protein
MEDTYRSYVPQQVKDSIREATGINANQSNLPSIRRIKQTFSKKTMGGLIKLIAK